MKKFMLLFLACAATGFAYPRLWCGTYQLSGGNTKWSGGAYQGEVTIQPQGENFRVVWQIGSSQKQVGIGILYRDVFSVAYVDALSGAWGVASYKLVADGELEGRWTFSDGTNQKPEYLIWKG